MSFFEFSLVLSGNLGVPTRSSAIAPNPVRLNPIVLAGSDLVATVTCSEKIAAFLLTIILDRLHRNNGIGLAALVLAPVRELASQVAHKLGVLATIPGVLAALILRNESMDQQIRGLTNRSGSRCRA